MSAAFPPGPRGAWLVGVLLQARRDPLGFLSRVAKENGDIVHVKVGGLHVYLLNHPDDIEQVLVTHQQRFVKGRSLSGARRLFGNGLLTSDGLLHSRQRKIIQPAFHRSRLGGYAGAIIPLTSVQRDGWRDGDSIDMNAEMSRLTLAIAARTLFGAEGDRLAAADPALFADAVDLLDVPSLPYAGLVDVLRMRQLRRFRRARAQLHLMLNDVVEQRRRNGGGDDLLSMLLTARREGMPEEQLRDELTTLLLAGHDTTANALAWAWLLLAANPAVEERLHAEVDDVIGGRAPVPDDLPALEFTKQVFAEAMRLYPPAWLLGRVAVERHEARGFVISPGSLVVLSPWVVHRDVRFYRDPERFDPDRWTPEHEQSRPRFAYFPFGGGSRGCMGEAFAWMEGILVLATIAQRWRFRRMDAEMPEPYPALTLKPRAAVMRATKR